ncbi:penicillin-binding transpeptidase domain-containing protein [Rummeliibacillus sp. NPDC094406]|uniref:penicillin-binding transpeptidase domain-containing protein n=1 Tax=Rummeliibacillus sp. NPDC094406 TaxID=3364511 RepID=UPI0037FD049A
MLIIYGLLFFLMFFRIFYIQVTGQAEGQKLAAKATARYEKTKTITADRGNILDRQGQVIAKDAISYRLVAVVNPKASKGTNKVMHVENPKKTAAVLAKYIDMDEDEIYKRLTPEKKDTYQVEFGAAGRDISHATMKEIEKEHLPGIIFMEDKKRFYPNGTFASNLIGIAGKKNDEDPQAPTVGKMGLEAIYNKELSGVNGNVQYKSDLFGYLLPNSKEMIQPAKDGDNVYLTIDKTIQNFLEDSMSKVYKQYNPESMVAVVADPKTGEILAVSQRPTFNPQTGEGLDNSWINKMTETTIEPGSTMKTFTLATAIQEGKWNPNDTFQSGQYTVYDRTIRDANQVGWGRITYLEGIQRSSNVGMANLLKKIGDDTFIQYMKKFGFGQKTGIDLPNEATGKILDEYPINRVTTTYGQGSTVTPIQLIQAETAIANNGKMMQPYVIDKVVDPNTGKIVKEHKPVVKGNPISAETAKQVRDTLATTVTSEKGTAQKFASKEYEVAGKTGTAQIPKPNGGYYWGTNNFLYSFLGMAPAKDPKLIMYVAVEKPHLGVTEVGSEPTSKIFNTVMDSSLKYLNIKPSKSTTEKAILMEDVVGQESDNVITNLESKNIQTIRIGSKGKITDQYPKKGQSVFATNHAFIKTSGNIQIPDFKGWSLRDILTYQSLSGIEIDVNGDGYVQKQNIKPGTVYDGNKKIVLTLEKPQQQYK